MGASPDLECINDPGVMLVAGINLVSQIFQSGSGLISGSGGTEVSFHLQRCVPHLFKLEGQFSGGTQDVRIITGGGEKLRPRAQGGREMILLPEDVVTQFLQFPLEMRGIIRCGNGEGSRPDDVAAEIAVLFIRQMVQQGGQCHVGDRFPPGLELTLVETVDKHRGEQEGDETGGQAGEDHHLLPDGGGDIKPDDDGDQGNRPERGENLQDRTGRPGGVYWTHHVSHFIQGLHMIGASRADRGYCLTP